MFRPRLVVTSGSVALLLAGSAWAGPPPPPPSGDPPTEANSRPGGNTAPPPPSSNAEGERLEAAGDPLVIDQRTPETDLTGAWQYSRRPDTAPNYVQSSEEDRFFTVNPIGYYQGVSVESGNLPPYAPKEIGGQSAVLTWTGFERGENLSRVFLQLSAAVEPAVVISDERIVIELPRTAVQVKNNRRKLITRYFKTPVDEIDIRRKGKSVSVVLELRWPALPTWELQPAPNGYQLLVFEFADEPSKAPAPPPAPPPMREPSEPPTSEPAEAPTSEPANEDEPGPFLPTGAT